MSVEVRFSHSFKSFSLDISFAIERAGVTALFGPSGAGKTTIVNALAGTFRPKQGHIIVNGRVVFDSAAGIFVPARHRRIGYVFQDARLFPHMSVEDNLLFGWRRAPVKMVRSQITDVIALLGLERLLQRSTQALSGGEKSRVALGRALLTSPELLLLDEPLSALDASRRSEILPHLERLRDEAKLPMLYVSHAIDEVARLAHDIVVIEAGQVVMRGSVFDVLTSFEFSAQTGNLPVGAVLVATLGHERADGLSALCFDGGTLHVPALAKPVGTMVRLRVRAEEIMLALEEPRTISANNVLLCKIAAIRRSDAVHADVQLALGNTRLVARITAASVGRLALQPGMPVFAIIKSVTVDSRLMEPVAPSKPDEPFGSA